MKCSPSYIYLAILTAAAITPSMATRGVPSKPNFFIGYRLNCPDFITKVEMMHQYIIDTYPIMKPMLTSAKKLHITGFVMSLQEDYIQVVQNALQDLQPEISSCTPLPMVSFSKLGKFSNRVLYIEPHDDDGIDHIRNMNQIILNKLRSIDGLNMEDIGLHKYDVRRWKAHVTVAKVKFPQPKTSPNKILVSEDDLNLMEERLGCVRVPIHSIDLLSMGEVDETGYYKSYLRIHGSPLT